MRPGCIPGPALLALALATGGCGSISVQDAGTPGAAGSGGGTAGTAGGAGTPGAAGTTGGGGTSGSAGRGGSDGTGAGGRGGSSDGTGGRGGNTGGAGGTGGACACYTIYMPVCGVDGKTYSNECEAKCMNVAIASQGACVTECQADADCVHYADGVGTCCGACLPKTAAKPATIACLVPCMERITCSCVVGKCTATPATAAGP